MSDQASITTIDSFAQALAAADDPAPQEAEAAQPETEAEDAPIETAGEVEGDPDEPVEEVEGEQPQEAESLDDKVVSWETASGDKFEVPVAELKNGYMREQDYRHKTQNLAQEREQATAHLQQQFQHVQAYKQDLGMVTALDIQIESIKSALAQTRVADDPVGYIEAQAQLQQLTEHRSGLATRMAQLEQQQQAQSQQQRVEATQKMVAELQTHIPNFSRELVAKLDQTGQEYGFTSQDLQNVTDARFVRILHDAMQFKALQAKAPAAVNRVKAAPVKPTKQASTTLETGVERAAKRFAASKTKDSFAALYAKTL